VLIYKKQLNELLIMKKILTSFICLLVGGIISAQTSFTTTNFEALIALETVQQEDAKWDAMIAAQANQANVPSQKYDTYLRESGYEFENHQQAWYVVHKGDTVGEFIPVWNVNLVTNQTEPHLFTKRMTMKMLHDSLKYGVAITPDGMTAASMPLRMEGKALANGVPCGDGKVYNYGIIIAHTKKVGLTFTHKKEIPDFQNQYDKVKRSKGTLFFLPAIYNKGSMNPSTKSTVDRILVNRITPRVSNDVLPGKQQGVIVFYKRYSYPKVMEIVFGLDRKYKNGSTKSSTKHVYVLDGGPNYGAVVKKNINGNVDVIGTRNSGVNSCYIVCY
jgi:hypothetical protein